MDKPPGAATRGEGIDFSWLCGGSMEGCELDSARGWGRDGSCTVVWRGENGAAGWGSMSSRYPVLIVA